MEDTKAGGRTVRASRDEPQYLVRSENSGRTAVHKPGALERHVKRRLSVRVGTRRLAA